MQKLDTNNSNTEIFSLLPINKSREALNDLDGWQSTDDHKMIYRQFICHDFMAAVDVIDHIAIIAQELQHHPDIHLTQFRNLRVGLTTHEVGGLSDKDFAVASKINDLPFDKEHQQLQNKKHAGKMGLEPKTESKKIIGTSVVTKKNKKIKGMKAKKVVNRMDQRVKNHKVSSASKKI